MPKHKAYKYRLYPTFKQKVLIDKSIGTCRLIYNLALETKMMAYKSGVSLSGFDLTKQLPELKKEFTWIKEVNSQSLTCAILDMDIAYKNFFKGAGYPKFKSKQTSGSFSNPQCNKVDFNKGRFYTIKFKEGIKCNFKDRTFEGKIKTCTISRSSTMKYFVSILVETEGEHPNPCDILLDTSVGLDLGIKDFATLSNGDVIDNPKYLRKMIDRLKVLQRRASKKKKGSNNWKKANKKVALLHEKISNKRKDFLHKLSTSLLDDFDTVCIEDLAVSNMIKNHKLAQAISDVSWYEFTRMLDYKCKWRGKNLLKIGRFDPSSKMCGCGVKNENLKLSDRKWQCESCGVVNDRDLLAAKNVKKFAFNKFKTGEGVPVVPVEQLELFGAMKQEV